MKGRTAITLWVLATISLLALFAFGYAYGREERPSQAVIDARAAGEARLAAEREALALKVKAERDAAELERARQLDAASGVLAWALALGAATLALGGAGVAVAALWRRSNLVYAQSGQFPLVRAGGLSSTVLIDPNRMANPATVIDRPGIAQQVRGAISGPAGKAQVQLSAPRLAAAPEQLQVTSQAQMVQLARAADGSPAAPRAERSFAPQWRPTVPPVEIVDMDETNLSHIQRLLENPRDGD